MIKHTKKPLSILLAALMIVSLFSAIPLTASATTEQVFAHKWVQAELVNGGYYSFTDLYQNFIVCRVNSNGTFNPADFSTTQSAVYNKTGDITLGGGNKITITGWGLDYSWGTDPGHNNDGNIYLSTHEDNQENYSKDDVLWYAYTWETFTAEIIDAKSADCTDAGNIAYYTVGNRYFKAVEGTKDGHQIVQQITQAETVKAATGHNFPLTAYPAVQATCTTAGNTAYWYCDRCDKYFSDADGTSVVTANSWIIPATGHNMTHHAAVAPTSFTPGNTEYWYCENCHKYFSDFEGNSEIAENSWVKPALISESISKDTSSDPFASLTSLGYTGARFLGFQKGALNGEAVKDNSLRFITELSSDVLAELNNDAADDYGYVFATVKSDGTADYNHLTIDSAKANVYSCKGTTNTIAGNFGDNNYTSTDYKYVTASVYNIPNPVKFVARFYITCGGTTYYVNYGDGDATGVVFNTADYLN